MKKTIIALSVILIISCLSVVCFASFSDTYTFYYGDREIVVEGNSLSLAQARTIANYIAYGTTPLESIGLGESINTPILCILFGHSTTIYNAVETIHNVYSESPKCLENYYKIEYCTRENCDYKQKNLIASYRISTCHG